MPAPAIAPPTSTYSSSIAPRIELDTDETDFHLGYDPSSFEVKHSRPPTADGKQSPDSPTLGTSQLEGLGVGDRPGTASGSDGEGRKRSRFVEEMATPGPATTVLTENPAEEAARHHAESSSGQAFAGASPPRNRDSYIVNPATIPIRTSSSNAVGANGEKDRSHRDSYGSSPTKKSPKKHRSLGSVPEGPEDRRFSRQKNRENTAAHPDERDWLAQGARHSTTTPNGYTYSHDRGASGSKDLNKYASTTFSQQPTLYHPPADPMRTVGSDLITGQTSIWSPEKENILRGPYDYLESHPGKDIRTQLITAFDAWLRVPEPSLAIITKVVGMLHTASLLIDDVEDNSLLRRGVPVAHQIFGVAQTINSANYVYFCALQELLRLNNPDVIRIYTDELLNLHRGQGMDLFWRDTLTCPSEDDYLEMVGNKTGGLFRLAIKLMCAESPSHNFNPSSSSPSSPSAADGPVDAEGKTDYIPLVNTIGLLFQILDDYRNLSDTTYTANKGLCEDLTEGKFSFPIIHSIRSDPQNLVLVNILKQKTKDDEVKRFAVGYMETTGSFAYTRRVLRGLTKKALRLVEEVDQRVSGGQGRGDGIRQILERLKVDRQVRASQSV